MLHEATIDETILAMNQQGSDDDKRLLVMFSRRPVQNKEKSVASGRPIFEEKDYVTILVPGDKDSIIERPASDMDRQRFARQYAAYQQKVAQETVAGTPLKAVTFISQAQAKELEYFNVYTVEQLAGMPDSNAAKIMGLQSLKQMANDFLAAAKDQSALTQMRAELNERDQLIANMKSTIDSLTSRLEALEEEKE